MMEVNLLVSDSMDYFLTFPAFNEDNLSSERTEIGKNDQINHSCVELLPDIEDIGVQGLTLVSILV